MTRADLPLLLAQALRGVDTQQAALAHLRQSSDEVAARAHTFSEAAQHEESAALYSGLSRNFRLLIDTAEANLSRERQLVLIALTLFEALGVIGRSDGPRTSLDEYFAGAIAYLAVGDESPGKDRLEQRSGPADNV